MEFIEYYEYLKVFQVLIGHGKLNILYEIFITLQKVYLNPADQM